MQGIHNWGCYPIIDADIVNFEQEDDLRKNLERKGEAIAYGNGRSYGDASLQKRVLVTKKYNSLHSFDYQTGILSCDAGILLSDILKVFVPKGWFLPVSPGTKFITIGGAIAADIHGKNHHHDSSFGQYIHEMRVMRSDGEIITCSRNQNNDFFKLTIGGMGLTGIILNVKVSLQKIETAYIHQKIIQSKSLNELLDQFESHDDWQYSVSWLDTYATGPNLGRGIFIKGRHLTTDELILPKHQNNPLDINLPRALSLPIDMPSGLLNNSTNRIFNSIYFHSKGRLSTDSIVSYEQFFYPLDTLKNWNRLYGKGGFTQYQFVLPDGTNRDVLKTILRKIQEKGEGSGLAVLKRFGEQHGFMSFPMPGYTLALDFPIKSSIFNLMKELDQMVMKHGGRLYLAKDVRMSEDMFLKTYPNADDFKHAISLLNNGSTKFASLLSNRLGITL